MSIAEVLNSEIDTIELMIKYAELEAKQTYKSKEFDIYLFSDKSKLIIDKNKGSSSVFNSYTGISV